MWDVRGQGRAEGLLLGQHAACSHNQQGSAGRKWLFARRKLNSAAISPLRKGQGSVLSAVERSRWGSSRHSLLSRSFSSTPAPWPLRDPL